jgi:hypothetical protein
MEFNAWERTAHPIFKRVGPGLAKSCANAEHHAALTGTRWRAPRAKCGPPLAILVRRYYWLPEPKPASGMFWKWCVRSSIWPWRFPDARR